MIGILLHDTKHQTSSQRQIKSQFVNLMVISSQECLIILETSDLSHHLFIFVILLSENLAEKDTPICLQFVTGLCYLRNPFKLLPTLL